VTTKRSYAYLGNVEQLNSYKTPTAGKLSCRKQNKYFADIEVTLDRKYRLNGLLVYVKVKNSSAELCSHNAGDIKLLLGGWEIARTISVDLCSDDLNEPIYDDYKGNCTDCDCQKSEVDQITVTATSVNEQANINIVSINRLPSYCVDCPSGYFPTEEKDDPLYFYCSINNEGTCSTVTGCNESRGAYSGLASPSDFSIQLTDINGKKLGKKYSFGDIFIERSQGFGDATDDYIGFDRDEEEDLAYISCNGNRCINTADCSSLNGWSPSKPTSGKYIVATTPRVYESKSIDFDDRYTFNYTPKAEAKTCYKEIKCEDLNYFTTPPDNFNCETRTIELAQSNLTCYYKCQKEFFVLPVNTTEVSGKESGTLSNLFCPLGTVIIGRYHKGDENSTSILRCASFGAYPCDNKNNCEPYSTSITTVNQTRTASMSKKSTYTAPSSAFLKGYRAWGDENGYIEYDYAYLKLDGKYSVSWDDELKSSTVSESGQGWFVAETPYIFVGKDHVGDENGATTYHYTKAKVRVTTGAQN
ncbi:MAG: hypothetical protein NC218_10895, partial [Acetobacter sp.]|nr:hypothetical protein [Acetobacter sp.]